MNAKKPLLLFAMLAAMTAGIAQASDPDRWYRGDDRASRAPTRHDNDQHDNYRRDDSRDNYRRNDYHHDDSRDNSRHDNYRHDESRRPVNRYYPARGRVIPVLPYRHQRVIYRGTRYYYSSGIWYRPYGPRFIVVAPPIGVVFHVPLYSARERTRYYATGSSVGYTQSEVITEAPADVMTEPPGENGEITETPISEEPISGASKQPVTLDDADLYVYPRQGQDKSRQAKDRAECRTWASQQIDDDSTVASTDDAGVDLDYRRALGACLEGRGYSVK